MKVNPFSIFIVVFIIFLIEVANLVFIPDWCPEFKSLIIEYSALILTGFGLITFWYEYTKSKKDFLDTKIEVLSKTTHHSIKTQLINKVGIKKEVSYAFLFISKQDTPPVAAMNNALNVLQIPLILKHTNDFEDLKDQIDVPALTTNAYIIPLSFYYSENLRIGNESPAYTFTFNNIGENKLENGIYTVRFFIFCKGKLHRSTADSLVIDNGSKKNNSDSPSKELHTPSGKSTEKSKSNI